MLRGSLDGWHALWSRLSEISESLSKVNQWEKVTFREVAFHSISLKPTYTLFQAKHQGSNTFATLSYNFYGNCRIYRVFKSSTIFFLEICADNSKLSTKWMSTINCFWLEKFCYTLYEEPTFTCKVFLLASIGHLTKIHIIITAKWSHLLVG